MEAAEDKPCVHHGLLRLCRPDKKLSGPPCVRLVEISNVETKKLRFKSEAQQLALSAFVKEHFVRGSVT